MLRTIHHLGEVAHPIRAKNSAKTLLKPRSGKDRKAKVRGRQT